MDAPRPSGPGPDKRRDPVPGSHKPPGSPDSGGATGMRTSAHHADSAHAAEHASDRFVRFAHELSSLIDGTMRYVALARAGIEATPTLRAGEEASHQLDAAASALERMAEMIHSAMRPCAGGVGSIDGAMSSNRSLLDAAQHAIEVIRPLAAERGVALSLNAPTGLESTPAGPLYTVLLNGVRNAVEACARNGRVDVQIGLFPRVGGGVEVRVDVLDDGVGPPRIANRDVFEPGFTTKPSGTGIGLSLCRDIVQQLGGEIELRPRSGAPDGRGAHLRVRCPLPSAA